MLERNESIKQKPEQFQMCYQFFDLVIACDYDVYCKVCAGNVGTAIIWIYFLVAP